MIGDLLISLVLFPPSIPPLDSLPLPTVTSPSNIASIHANSLINSNTPAPGGTTGVIVSQVGQVLLLPSWFPRIGTTRVLLLDRCTILIVLDIIVSYLVYILMV